MLAVLGLSDSASDCADQEPTDCPDNRRRDPELDYREPCRRRIREQANDQSDDSPHHTEATRTDNDKSREWREIA